MALLAVFCFGCVTSAYAQTASQPTNEDLPTFYIDKPTAVLAGADGCISSSNDRGDMWCNSGVNYQTSTRWDKNYTLDRIAIQMCWNTTPNNETKAFWETGHALINGYNSTNQIVFSLINDHSVSSQFYNNFTSYNGVTAEILNPHVLPLCDGSIEFTDAATVIYKLNAPLTVFTYQTLYTRFTGTYYGFQLPYGETVFNGAAQKPYLTNDFGVYANSWDSPKFVLAPMEVTELNPKAQVSYGYCEGSGCSDKPILGTIAAYNKWGVQYQLVNNDIGGFRYFQYMNFIGENNTYNFDNYIVGGGTSTTTPPEFPTTEYAECGITSGQLILGCIKNAFIWAFVPDKVVFDRFIALKDQIAVKPPVGYITSIISAFDFSSSTPQTFELTSTTSPFYTFIFQPIRNILLIILYMFGAVWLFRRVKDVNI